MFLHVIPGDILLDDDGLMSSHHSSMLGLEPAEADLDEEEQAAYELQQLADAELGEKSTSF